MSTMDNSQHQLLFATNNAHKISEVRNILGPTWAITSLEDAGIQSDLPETGDTLTANAIEKVDYIFELTRGNCFAEDSGLEVDSLHGAPGVYTARYAGPNADAEANNQKLLQALSGESNRAARFRAIIALRWHGELITFEGVVEGKIASGLLGRTGFGYDPLFIPEGYDLPFAALPSSVKSEISHRFRAVSRMRQFLVDSQAQGIE